MKPYILHVCCLLFYSWVLSASFIDLSFDEMVKSKKRFDGIDNLETTERALWQKYTKKARADSERLAQHNSRALHYNEKTMRFSLDTKNASTKKLKPVYIALHGGGGAPASINDSQWQHMQSYYLRSVDDGIYVAPRGITNTWNLHFRNESYPLYDRLIENLIVYENADPNRVYLLGFSAGGDGVYQIVPRMPDRFAAANMSAGHHNWIKFDNLAQTPFLLQVGEYDVAYDRNKVAAQNYFKLNDLRKKAGFGYLSELFIHKGSGHNGWRDNDPSKTKYVVIKNPKFWLTKNDRSSTRRNTNAVDWLNNFQRQLPKRLVWDLSTRAPRQKTWGAQYVNDESLLNKTRNLFYWLAIDDFTNESGRIEARIDSVSNSIHIEKLVDIEKFRILLHRNLLDFNEPINVFFDNELIISKHVTPALSTMARTLLERGDKSYIFHSEIKVDLSNKNKTSLLQPKFSYCSNGYCTITSAEFFKKLRAFPSDLNYTCANDNHYALTFDDGPSSNFAAILEILEQHNVKATFFVNGNSLEKDKNKALIKKASDLGHDIANHTYTHRSLDTLSSEEVLEEVEKTKNMILDTLGHNSKHTKAARIVRPPYGNINNSVQNILKDNDFVSVRWNSDRYDWQLGKENKDIIITRVKDHLNLIEQLEENSAIHKSIIDLNHDKSQATVHALDSIIPMIKKASYEFVTISECL